MVGYRGVYVAVRVMGGVDVYLCSNMRIDLRKYTRTLILVKCPCSSVGGGGGGGWKGE